ncbi:MAG: ATP-dependent DNA ligase, partial [Gemmatimonadota bacterium]
MTAGGLASFVAMYVELDRTTATGAKLGALQRYFSEIPPLDAVWAIQFLTGRQGRRPIATRHLRSWAADFTGLPEWLIEASYHAVGDLAETLALLCARGEGGAVTSLSLADFAEREIDALRHEPEQAQRSRVEGWWRAFDAPACLVVHKLLTGGFRVGVSATLVARALAGAIGREPAQVAHRLMGNWAPDAAFAARLFAAQDDASDRSRPYPFYLASPLEGEIAALGDPRDWLTEWKWDGIRAQLLVRGGEVYLWSRGEELITERFPEIAMAARALPSGTVIDGELVPWRDGRVLPFGVLQTRIGRTNLTARALRDAPVVLLAFDLLERDGEDERDAPQHERRAALEALLAPLPSNGALQLSPMVEIETWEALGALRAGSRERGVEGLMLKAVRGPYRVGRPRGEWWKWKIEPYTVDAVLVNAQVGHGRRASLYTDYTFAVHEGDQLVPVAKAYSGLTDDEIRRLDAWIRANTLQRFGPVRAVTPHHVFELGFEGIQASSRHKSGVA